MKLELEPASPELVERFNGFVPLDGAVERRQMFGYPCAFIGGNLFMGLNGAVMFLRLPDALRAEFLALPDAKTFEPVPGKPMREYVVVPAAVLANAKLVKEWIAQALTFAKTLPPKAK